ncbi:hypothetical protein ACV56Z_03255 [Staphylococcus aureus]
MKDFDSLIPGWFKEFVVSGTDLISSQYFNWSIIDSSIIFTISSKIIDANVPEMFRALVERPETLEDGVQGYFAIPER